MRYVFPGRCKLQEEELKSYVAKETSQLTKSSRLNVWSIFKKTNGFQKEIPLIGRHDFINFFWVIA